MVAAAAAEAVAEAAAAAVEVGGAGPGPEMGWPDMNALDALLARVLVDQDQKRREEEAAALTGRGGWAGAGIRIKRRRGDRE